MLESVGFAPLAVNPDVDETKIIGASPVETAELRASAKGEAVLEQINRGLLREHVDSAIIVAADQVVYLEDKIFGKPKDNKSWFERLKVLRGQGHALTTAVKIIVFKDGRKVESSSFAETTQIHMHSDLTDAELWSYVEDGEASSCAGGYMVERKGAWLISHMDGDYSNVVGLPIPALIRRLRKLGLRPDWLSD